MFKKRRSIKLVKGVRVNVGKKGVTSVSLGGKGLTLNASKKGLKGTASIPGTGISTSGYITKGNVNSESEQETKTSVNVIASIVIIGFVLWLLY